MRVLPVLFDFLAFAMAVPDRGEAIFTGLA
jgi:hypothetical protein